MAHDKPEEAPWHAAYPEPQSKPGSVSRDRLLQAMTAGEVAGRDFLLVDVRRNDFEGGTIAGSINLPAQSIHATLPTLYNMVAAAKIKRVIWYCGSCRGRGPRAAAWFADYANARKDEDIESLILEGGIKGWVAAGEEFTTRMHEFDASKWQK